MCELGVMSTTGLSAAGRQAQDRLGQHVEWLETQASRARGLQTDERGQRRRASRSEETGDPGMRQAAEGAAESALPEELVALLTGHLNVKADAGEFSGRTTFESLGLDSLSLMEFVVAAEEEYGIVLPENALDLRPSSTLGEAARAFEHAR